MVEKGARALGKAWGMNMGLGTLRMNGFTEGVKRLKKLMEEEVRMSVANQHPSTTFSTRFDARGNGRDTKPFCSTLRRYTFGGGEFFPSILVSTIVCARPLLLNMHASLVCFPGQADMAEREASGVWTGHLPAAFSG